MYTESMGLEICERIAKGETLKSICKSDGMPNPNTVITWGIDPKHPFCELYARARRVRAELLIDEIIPIADDGSNDTYIDKDGVERVNNDVIQRSRLKVDTRKWIACKVLPKIYGDRIHTEHSGAVGLTSLITESLTDKKEE